MDFNEELKELLFGVDENQMNLTSIKNRVEDLLNRIDSVITSLTSTTSAESKWKAGLDAYSLVTIHLQRLLQSTTPLMRRYVACPIQHDPDIANVLATQLHPEQEAEKQQIVEDITEDDDELSKMVERIDERNELIINLVRVSRKPGSGLLDPKGPTRKRRAAKSAEIRHEVRQFNERHHWQTASTSKKHATVHPPNSATGFGALTNALLFGNDLVSKP